MTKEYIPFSKATDRVIAVDFDNTLAFNGFPDITKAIPNRTLMKMLKRAQNLGYSLILWTCREDYGGKFFDNAHSLTEAVSFCRKYGLFFNAINHGNVESAGDYENKLVSRKVPAQIYIDDAALPFLFRKSPLLMKVQWWFWAKVFWLML